jgi:uncharacterized membrane protein
MRRPKLKRAGLTVVFLWFAIGGVAHFAATRLEMSIVPSYISFPRSAVLVSGVSLIRPSHTATLSPKFVSKILTESLSPLHSCDDPGQLRLAG